MGLECRNGQKQMGRNKTVGGGKGGQLFSVDVRKYDIALRLGTPSGIIVTIMNSFQESLAAWRSCLSHFA